MYIMLYENTRVYHVIWEHTCISCYMRTHMYFMLYENTHVYPVIWEHTCISCYMRTHMYIMLYENTHVYHVIWEHTCISCYMRTHMYFMLYENTDIYQGLSWSWSYGSWIYNYLCNQHLSPIMLWVRSQPRWVVLNTTLLDKVSQWLVAWLWFSLSTLVFSGFFGFLHQ